MYSVRFTLGDILNIFDIIRGGEGQAPTMRCRRVQNGKWKLDNDCSCDGDDVSLLLCVSRDYRHKMLRWTSKKVMKIESNKQTKRFRFLLSCRGEIELQFSELARVSISSSPKSARCSIFSIIQRDTTKWKKTRKSMSVALFRSSLVSAFPRLIRKKHQIHFLQITNARLWDVL